ncbi:MAG: TonB-dependent receptor, partial [Tannerella sp.]|nr:TonB-dependent receptor [Tannerella sp.]
CFSLTVSAQKRVTGTVLDASGETVIGANVVEKGTTNGTSTDSDGKFVLTVGDNAVLQISYVGYVTQEIKVGNQTNLNITLLEDAQTLDEVVVVGYGTQRKKDLTGAISTVSSTDIVNRKKTQLSTALQGSMPGVMVTRDNSAPGAGATVRIRGITTIGDSEPLVIVDGMQVSGINDVNPNDIESVSVLKDAASASIYGSQAAAGVILIQTKRAKTDQFNLEYNFEYGIEKPTALPKAVGIIRYMEMTNELRWNDAGNGADQYPMYSQDYINNYMANNAKDPDLYPNTNWRDLLINSSAPRQSHILNISGGTQKLRSVASIAYDQIGGFWDNRDYNRFTVRVNNDFKLNNLFAATLDISLNRSIDGQAVVNPMGQARIMSPVYAALWSDGRYAEGKSGLNYLANIKEGGSNDYTYNNVFGKVSLDFMPFEGFKLSGIFSPRFYFNSQKNWVKQLPRTTLADPSVVAGYFENATKTMLTENRNNGQNFMTQFLATYNKTIGVHYFDVLAGYENAYSFNEYLMASRDQFNLTSYPYLNIGPLEYRDNSGNADEYARRSYFGRINYSFATKYLIQANIRYDASSRFADGYRWGAFPSVSAGWVISEEEFMKTIPAVSFLKLRASYGSLGNERIGNYPYQATISFANALFYNGNTVVSKQTAAQTKYVINDISWETTDSYNIALDANFLDNRLRFTGEFYKKETRDMLLALQIPSYMGFDNPDQNTGKMHTTGWDLNAEWMDRAGDFGYSVSFNLSDFKSVMGDLGGTEFLGDQIKIEGSEFNEWYGYRASGIFQTAEEVANSAKISNSAKPGDIKYVDISGPDGKPDGIVNADYDKVLLGGSLPRYMFGGNARIDYRNFDFSLSFQGVGKQNSRITSAMINSLEGSYGNFPAIVDGKYYSNYNTAEQNRNAKYPRLTYSNPGNNLALSDYWIFNGAYFRLKSIGLGYTVPQTLANKMYLKGVRLYVNASDLFSISNYPQGWDPERSGDTYPISTTYLFGISVKF